MLENVIMCKYYRIVLIHLYSKMDDLENIFVFDPKCGSWGSEAKIVVSTLNIK